MKRFFSFLLVALLLFYSPIIQVAYAADVTTADRGTQIVCKGSGSESYVVTVPALLNPGSSGTVTLEGTWSSRRVVSVSSDTNVILTNVTNESQQKDLAVHFPGIISVGNDLVSQKIEQTVTVDEITGALFSKWVGRFHYYVDVTDFGDGIRHDGTIPAGGNYYVGIADSFVGHYDTATATYGEGDVFPIVSIGDVYTWGDYEYKYGYTVTTDDNGNQMWELRGDEGWGVTVLDTHQTSYDSMLGSVNKHDVINAVNTYCNCTNMVRAPEIPSSVVDITCAFKGCSSMEVAPILHEGIVEMGWSFEYCESLKKAPEIPYGVVDMDGAFSGCVSMEEMTYIPDTVQLMGYTFLNCHSLVTVPNLPSGLTSLFQTFTSCHSIKSIPELPQSVSNLGWAFAGCRSLTSIPDIPESVWYAEAAFNYCEALTGNVALPCHLASSAYQFPGCPANITYYHTSYCSGDCGI